MTERPMEIQRRAAGAEPRPPDDADVLASDEARGMALVKPSELPSGYLPYPQGASIYYRSYNYDELTTFSDSALTPSERAAFVMRGVLCRGMDPDDLTVSDWLYLGLLRKVSVFRTSKFNITVPADPRTGRRAHTERVNVADLAVHDLDVPDLPAVADIGGREMHFSPLTMGRFGMLMDAMDAEADAAYREARRKSDRPSEVERPAPRDPSKSELMGYQCVNMEPDEAVPLIREATGVEMAALEYIDDAFRHKVKPMTIKWTQRAGDGYEEKECAETVEVDDPAALVWPFRGSEEHGRGAVRFGLQGNP